MTKEIAAAILSPYHDQAGRFQLPNNFDAIIAVGCRINTRRATVVLRDYALGGYVIDRKRSAPGSREENQ